MEEHLACTFADMPFIISKFSIVIKKTANMEIVITNIRIFQRFPRVYVFAIEWRSFHIVIILEIRQKKLYYPNYIYRHILNIASRAFI